MKLKEIAEAMNFETVTGGAEPNIEINRGYVSDLLSDVIANTQEGDLWITLHIHPNIAAVAGMKELSGIVIINGRRPEKETIDKAEDENIPILVSDLPAFEVIGRLYKLGITGMKSDAEEF